MSNNPSFVLKGILDVEIQPKPIPESECIFDRPFASLNRSLVKVNADEVLVEVKKTGTFTESPYHFF
jgi:D-xylulose reductase